MARTGLTFTGLDDTSGFIGAKARASTFRTIQASLEDVEKTNIQTIHTDSVQLNDQFTETTGASAFDTIVSEVESGGAAIVIYEVPIYVSAGVQNVIGEMSGQFYGNAGSVTLTGKIDLLQLDGTAFAGSSTATVSRDFSANAKVPHVIFTPMMFRFTSALSAQQEAVLKYYITVDSSTSLAVLKMAFFIGLSFSTFALRE